MLLLFSSVINAQKINGLVTDSNNDPISLVMVQLLDEDQNILQYSYTDEEGKFEFSTSIENARIEFLLIQGLFYQKQRLIYNDQKFFPITLIESNAKLKEIVIKAQKICRDTVALGLSKRNIDRTDKVEDALKKIPGINIDKHGRISYLNKEIEKILIDGDDLAGKQYTFISRNLRAEVLQEIEVLKNYEENTILRNVQNSNKIALNLRLKDAYKDIWFGNIDGTYGNDLGEDQEYKATSTVSLLNSKIKLLGAVRYSTLGDRAITEQFSEQGDRPSVMDSEPFYRSTDINVPLPETVINFNKAYSTTILLNKNIGGYSVRSTNYIARDNLNQFYNRTTIFPFQGQETLNENFVNNNKILKFQGDVTINSKEATRNFIKSTLLYDITKSDGLSNLQVENQFINDDLQQQSIKVSNLNELTTLLNNNLIIDSYLNLGLNDSSEKVSIQSSEQLFPNQFDGDRINQEIRRNIFLADIGSSSRVQLNDKSVLKLSVSGTYSNDRFRNQSSPTGVGFDFAEDFDRLDLQLPITYIYRIKRSTSFIVNFEPRYSVINKEEFGLYDYSAQFETIYLGSWSLAYFRKNKLPLNDQLVSGTFISGTNTIIGANVPFEPIKEDQFSLRHKIRNRSSSLENEITLGWSRAESVLLTNLELQGNFNIIDLDLVRLDQNTFNLKEQLVWLFGSYGLNIITNHSIVTTPISSENDITSRIVVGSYNLKLNSYYNSGFNFEVKVEYMNSIQEIENIKNRFENYSLELDLSYELNETLDFGLSSYSSRVNASTYNVLNLESKYVPKKKNYSLSAGVFNLFNEDQFVTQQRETFFFSTTSIPLKTRLPYIKYTYTF
ncbi:carboxypeptidase-like regulatory domain-containing protein [Nonlabens antarcticus]|uniref:carboxypeptidase-like regulatory domain-containing protein n=1 Tax=Nonlabens antarcticus TaxID=392714 RepID=UPI001891A896|nr:carboxypeptidase-like regulatory domain-containing protein [Nonlabens antarcticus]